MSLKKLPEIQARSSKNISFDPPDTALNRWQSDKQASANEDVLRLYGAVGDDWDENSITAHNVANYLKGKQDITVSINSCGGSYFEGVSIYNLLRAHPHKVTVQVIGDAASAASIIAMAGDDILMGDGAFMMIHNAWGVCIGNRQDLKNSIDLLENLDNAMADLYVARTGKDKAEIVAMMDAETWFSADEAVAQGFATARLHQQPDSQANSNAAQYKARAQIESALRAQGFSRTQSRQILHQYRQDGSAEVSKPVANNGINYVQALNQLNNILKGK